MKNNTSGSETSEGDDPLWPVEFTDAQIENMKARLNDMLYGKPEGDS